MREEIAVLFISCADEVSQIRAAWTRLEAIVPPKGRRFFGACDPGSSYRACVQRLDGEESGALEAGVLPGGKYLRERLRGEPPGVYERIGPGFEALQARGRHDPSRPLIEHYRRRDEIDLLLPVV